MDFILYDYGLITILVNEPETDVTPPPVPVAVKVPVNLLLALAVITTLPEVGLKPVDKAPVLL